MWALPAYAFIWNTTRFPSASNFLRQAQLAAPSLVAVDHSLVLRNHSASSPFSNALWHIRKQFPHSGYIGIYSGHPADQLDAKSREYTRQLDLLIAASVEEGKELAQFGVPVDLLPPLPRLEGERKAQRRAFGHICGVVIRGDFELHQARARLRQVGFNQSCIFFIEAQLTVENVSATSHLLASSVETSRYLSSRGITNTWLYDPCLTQETCRSGGGEEKRQSSVLDGMLSALSSSDASYFPWEKRTRWQTLMERRKAK